MRKIIPVLLLALLLTGCQAPWNRNFQLVQPVDFYYTAREETAFDLTTGGLYKEERDLGETQYSLPEILRLYLAGPVTDAAGTPFPEDLTVEEQTLKNGCLTVCVSSAWDRLSGVDRHLAEACLVMTMTQFTEVETVCIRTPGSADVDLLRPEDYLLYDDSATSDQVTVKLYFSDKNSRYLVEETRSQVFASEEDTLSYIVREIISGPAGSVSLAAIPEGTNLLRIALEQGVCTVDLSEAFWSNRPKTHAEARMAVFSIVNALTEHPQVESVRFLCVGQPMGDYAGLDLSQPLYREELALGQSRSVGNALDRTLYVPCTTGEKLAAVPTYVRQSAGKTGAEAVLSALLSFKPANGYENPFPDGTVLMELYTSNGVCHVTFNSAFGLCDAQEGQAQKAVRSVVSTLCALDGVEQVQITVSGGSLNSLDLSLPLTPRTDWLLP